ncbi:MAG: phosphoribosylamine--glycine ligase [Gammaproteobacteria bacterium]
MKILVIGNGGREHALAWKIKQSPKVTQVYVAPGNAGTALEPGVQNVAIAVNEVEQLAAFASQQHIDLTIVGPELPLSLGIVDLFQARDLPCFGPCRWAAQLETSKAFSKAFMQAQGIPTARYECFTEVEAAKRYLQQQTFPIVIKADGLAAGKGVVIAQDLNEAEQTVTEMLSGQTLQGAGKKVVIEEFLTGEEVSFIVVCDGKVAIPLASSQDHKRRDDGDLGPNTGGMGAYSPAPIFTASLQDQVMQAVINPVLRGMAENGTPYRGFLYAGLMITPDRQPKVLEFNCRLGDPETQPLLMRLQSDLLDICLATALDAMTLSWDPRPALGVVMAAKGYPEQYPQGDVIKGLSERSTPDVKVFHAGTRLEAGEVKTAGGRVLCVTALGDTLQAAYEKAYAQVGKIDWGNQYFRRDIGHRAIG